MWKAFTMNLTGIFNPLIPNTMTILEKLEEKRIVGFEIATSGTSLLVQESCDYYYKTWLTKAEVGQLIKELKSLHKQMKNQKP